MPSMPPALSFRLRPPPGARLALAGLLALLAAGPAAADRADRLAPLNFSADTARVDDLRKVHQLRGNVEITKGTIVIKSAQVEVRQDKDGHQTAVASGGPRRAYFKQKREGLDEFIEGEAERLEYDSRADTVRLHNQAVMRRLRGGAVVDEVAGSTIVYDNAREVFQVQGGGAPAEGATTGRVRGTLSPREATGAQP